MDPILLPPYIQSNPPIQAMGGFMFAPGIFLTENDASDYLSSLDSDTRDYVMNHTDEFRSRGDIDECIRRLHKES